MVGDKTAEVERFWQECRARHAIDGTDYHACTFADPDLSQKVDEIGGLALNGQKRATAHLELDFEINGVARRRPGDYWVLLDRDGRPRGLLRVTKVEVTPFDAVGTEMAIAEGEGDLSLEYWARVHRIYFEKQCTKWGRTWDESLPVVCEYFELVEVL